MSKQYTISLVKSQVFSLQKLLVLLYRGWVLRETLLTVLGYLLPHRCLVLLTNNWDLVGVEDRALGLLIRIIRHVSLPVSAVLELTLDLVKQCYILVEHYKPQEGYELLHYLLLHVHLYSECPLHCRP